MVYHNNQCIQVHIPKTAGVTIRNVLGIEHLDKWMHIKPDHPRYQPYWNKYFTFTFVRNPWDRLVSCYFFSFKKPTGQAFNHKIYQERPDFHTFVMKWLTKDRINDVQRFQPQVRWIVNPNTGKEWRYDFIGKVENLQHDLIWIINKCSFNHSGLKKIPTLNITNHHDFREYYDYDTYAKVAELYAEDVQRFGYSFEEEWGKE